MRINKFISNSGICSRRQAEELIASQVVRINGQLVTHPAVNVALTDKVTINNQLVKVQEQARLWLYHKPCKLLVTHADPQGRPTIFQYLPKSLPRVISVGRLDFNSEGLLLLTNTPALSRKLELPQNRFVREYKVRAYGNLNKERLAQVRKGSTIKGIIYQPIEVTILDEGKKNTWLMVTLYEGKNREVRNILQYCNLEVNRLIRLRYGSFTLDPLRPGQVTEVASTAVQQLLL